MDHRSVIAAYLHIVANVTNRMSAWDENQLWSLFPHITIQDYFYLYKNNTLRYYT